MSSVIEGLLKMHLWENNEDVFSFVFNIALTWESLTDWYFLAIVLSGILFWLMSICDWYPRLLIKLSAFMQQVAKSIGFQLNKNFV